MQMRDCPKCCRTLMTSAFGANRASPDGVRSECRECAAAAARCRTAAKRALRPPKPEVGDPQICRGCGDLYPRTKSGHRHCYPCLNIKRQTAPGAAERLRGIRKATYEKHKEKIRAAIYARRHAEPGTLCDEKRIRAERLAAQSDGSLTRDAVRDLFAQAKVCPYCTAPLHWSEKTLDHIMPLKSGGAHGLSNVLVCCRSCNTRKSAKPPDRWLAQIRMDHGEAAFGAAFLILGPAIKAITAA